jgi:outer membrane protein assembly factor BamA
VLGRPLSCMAVLLVFVTTGAWADCAPDYRVDKNSGVSIQDFIVNGTTSLDSRGLQRIRGKLIGACVDEQTDGLEQLVKDLFQNEGYYAAVVKNLDIRTVDPLAHPKTISLETEIVEGPIFKFGQVNFVGNHAFTTAELRNALSLRKGEVAKRNSIASGFDGIRKLYLPNGFGDLMFIPDDTADLGSFTVNLTLTFVEGPQ